MKNKVLILGQMIKDIMIYYYFQTGGSIMPQYVKIIHFIYRIYLIFPSPPFSFWLQVHKIELILFLSSWPTLIMNARKRLVFCLSSTNAPIPLLTLGTDSSIE